MNTKNGINNLIAILSLLSVGVTSAASNGTVCQSILDSNPDASACVEATSGGAAFYGRALTNDAGIEVDSFKGLRYAEQERFNKSEVIAVQDGDIVNATEFGDACAQAPNFFFPKNGSLEEDCLYLNIWKPSNSEDEDDLLPVMVWIHGGGFTMDASSNPLYDGANLAGNENVIVVSVNYRLGVFGFMPIDDEGTGSMNGILDQIQALHWVQNNIEIFGGNPELVTIFGESAGAQSVVLLSVVPQAEGLFKRAISESGNTDANLPPTDVESVLSAIECSEHPCTISDMKDKTTEELLAAFTTPVGPTHPGDPAVLPTKESKLYSEGKINPEDMIVGSNTFDDMYVAISASNVSAYISMAEQGLPNAPFFSFANLTTPEEIQAAVDAYSWDKYNGSSLAAMSQFDGDVSFTCSTRDLAVTAATSGISGNIFVYLFGYTSVHEPAVRSGLLDAANITYQNYSSHGGELAFVFGNGNDPYSDQGKKLSSEIMSRWANFARTGNPNLSSEDNDEEGEGNEWLPVSLSDTSGMVAADPQYMYFTGDGGALVESNREKAEQCATIYGGDYPTFNHGNNNNDSGDGIVVSGDEIDVVVAKDDHDDGLDEPVSGGVPISFTFVASATRLLAALVLAL